MTSTPELIDLSALQREVETATKQWQDAERETSHARTRETTALNRLNSAQKALDAAVAKLKEKAPRDSDWRRREGPLTRYRIPHRIKIDQGTTADIAAAIRGNPYTWGTYTKIAAEHGVSREYVSQVAAQLRKESTNGNQQ